MNTAPLTCKLNTLELRAGDLLHFHGMLVRLDTEMDRWTGPNGDVQVWDGIVENLQKVLDERLMLAARFYRRVIDPKNGLSREQFVGRWCIQGDKDVLWTVEVTTCRGCGSTLETGSSPYCGSGCEDAARATRP